MYETHHLDNSMHIQSQSFSTDILNIKATALLCLQWRHKRAPTKPTVKIERKFYEEPSENTFSTKRKNDITYE